MIINKIFILYFALLTVADSDYALDPTNMSTRRKFIDIGANLADQMFQGIYNKQTPKHPPDLENVLQRAFDAGLEKIIITGTNLEASQKAIELSQTDDRLFATVGVHPTHCNDFLQNDCEIYSNSLRELIKNNSNKVVSFGEIGLDYDRLMFCSKEDQKKYFIHQLDISKEFELPLFLHMRSCEEDFLPYLEQRKGNIRGVVHSFDGNTDAMHRIIDVGLYIGINGCSLKTEDNLSNVRHIPKDRLLIETDSPWCEIKPSHAGYKYIKTKLPAIKKEKWEKNKLVKGRNEPCNIIQVLEVLAAVREEDPDELADQIFKNTEDLFFSKSK